MFISQHRTGRSRGRGYAAVVAIVANTFLAQAAWAGTWVTAPSPAVPGFHLNGIWGSASSNVYTVGATGSILHWNESAWSLMASPTTRELFGIWGSAANNIYAVGDAGTIVRFDGTAWSVMTSQTTQNLKRVWGSGPADIWAVGEGSTILHCNGTSWTNLNKAIAGDINAIWGSGPHDVYAVDGSGHILHYDGSDWSVIRNASGLLYGIWGTAGNNIYAVGLGGATGTILHYNGGTWSSMASNSAATLYDVWGSGPNDIYAVGTDYTGGGNSPAILHFDGTTWSAMSGPADVALQAVWGSGANDVYAVSYQGTILYKGTARNMGSVAFDAAACSTNRYIGFASVAVTRTGGSVAGASVDYATSDGTGVAGIDYVSTSGTLTFGLNETTKYIMVDTQPGAAAGATFTLTLSNPGGGALLGAGTMTTVTIFDGGTPPILSVEHLESSMNAVTFRVQLSRPVEWAVLADYASADGTATAGTEYTETGGTLVILPGDTVSTISVNLIADANVATGKTFTMTLSNPYGATLGTAQASGTIEGERSGVVRCGAGTGAANMVVFYALCWIGLAAQKWRPRHRHTSR